MDRKKIVLQSVLISGAVCLGAVLSAQALSLGGDTTTNTGGFGTGTLNTNLNTSTTTTTTTSTVNDANIQFNEFFGNSTTGWVELYNAGSTSVDVTNWVILSNKGNSQILTGVVTPYGYATFNGITADSLATLQSDSGQVIDTQTYTAVTTTQSWSQYTTNVFACDASPTKLAVNAKQTCTTTNSNTNQNINNNTNTTNTNPNTTTTTTETTGGVNATSSLYTIDRAWESIRLALTVDDEKEAELALDYAEERLAEAEDIITEEQQTKVGDTNTNNTNNINNANNVNTQQNTTTDNTSTVKLSEVVHKDYIELYNPGTKAVDITGYTLEIKDVAGVKTYVLPTTNIEAGKYIAIFASVSGLQLDETGGRVRLLNTSATAVSTTITPYDVYANAWAFNLTTMQWACTSTATKEATNAFADCVAKTDEQVSVNDNTNQVAGNTNQVIITGTEEEVQDTDQDGLTDEVETENATDPEVADTDGDGVDDANDPEPTGEESVDVEEETANTEVENSNGNTNEAIENTNEEAENINEPEDNINEEVINENEEEENVNEENTNEAVDEKVPEDEGTELSEEAAAAVEETMTDFEELVDHAGEQEVSEEAAATNAETLTELVDEIEAIQEEVAGETDEVLEEAKTNAEEEVAVLENGVEGEVTNENTNEPEENINEEVTNENENSNEVVDENGDEFLEEPNVNGEENINDNSNESVNENTVTNNTNEAVDSTNPVSNDNTNSESNDVVVNEDIDAQRLQEELDLAIDEINKLREENEALQAKVKELEDKLYATTGEDVSEKVVNTNSDSGTQSSLTGNDKYSIVTRESQLPDFTNVVEHVYFRELRAQPGDFTSTPGEYAFHNLDKVMYKLKLPDGSMSAAIYPGEVFIMDLEGGEYSYSSANHPDFGPYKITVE